MTQAFNLSQLANNLNTSGQLNASTGLSSAVPVANGGTGQTTYTNGQLLIGNTTGNTLTKATLIAGSGISITNGAGSISIASTVTGGVTSLNGQTGAITNTGLGVIGSYFLSADDTSIGARSIGATYAGSTLLTTDSGGDRINAGLSGTWRMMGANQSSANQARLYVRIS
jgi:hypothetical protein